MSEAADLQAALTARALENARTVEGWDVDKQRRYEQFMQGEKEKEDRHKADREATDTAVIACPPPVTEPPPPDPWETVLAEVPNMPNVSGALERANGYVKVTSAHLLSKVLGIPREKIIKDHTVRLARVMGDLGWYKPKNIFIGKRALKGYRKFLEEYRA